jgi:pimeloyl-ACP methyl ester carboxylesterase
MDQIRMALGAKQINYYGYSYGTYLGQVYATLFGDKIRRMVLDSNVDPRRVWYDANLDQDVAFNRNINIWFDWLAKYDNVFHLGKSGAQVSQLFYATRDKLDKKAAGGVIGGDEWTDIFLNAGYYKVTWLDLGKLFADFIANGDYKPLQAEYAPNAADDNGYAIYNGVQCTDVQWPTSWAKWRADNWRVNAIAPFETWANAWFNAPCLTWPAKAGTPVNVNGSKVKSGLLVDGTLDAATPYTGSLEVRRLYPHSSLLALPGGTSHANSLFGNACEDNTIARYLATGALPQRRAGNNTADAFCAPLPQPVPTSGAAIEAAPLQKAAGSTATRPELLMAHP